jgi:hypothetical protein
MMRASGPIIVCRVGIIAASLGLWFWTQWLLSRRKAPASAGGAIFDGVHRLTAGLHKKLIDHPRRADALLIVSSLVIDLLGLWMLATAIFGPTIEPFLGLIMLFALRQICQAVCALPPPQGMIWRNPGVPALLVTYGTSEDLFFSGHTALAVYGALFLAGALGPWGIVLGILIALFEISAVLVLRAHYTMDVFAGAVTALYVHQLAWQMSPTVDGWIAHLIAIAGHG